MSSSTRSPAPDADPTGRLDLLAPERRGSRFRRGGVLDAPSRPAVTARDRVFRRSLGVADALATAVALLAGVWLLGDDTLRPGAILFVPLTVLVSKLLGLYDRDELLLRRTTLDDASSLVHLASIYAVLVWLLAPHVVSGTLGRAQVVGVWVLVLACTLAGRGIARMVARRVSQPERCLIVSDAHTRARLAQKLRRTAGLKAEVADAVELGAGRDLADSLRAIEDAITFGDVHRVIVAPRSSDSDAVLDAIRLAKGLGVKVSLLPRVFEVVGSSVEFDDLDGITVLGLRRFGLTRSSWLLKRSMDWVGALAMLTVTAPLMLVIAVVIRIESRGPVLFRQTRVGRNGERFQMVKFRTMVDGADAMKHQLLSRNEAQGLFKIADDPRVTAVGRWLRRTSLDELPQLVNVLRGEMSLVGPRPLVVDEDDKVRGWDRRRLHLTPGMTGHWQILGSSRIPLQEMVKIDYLYVANWSMWGDVKILLRTIPYMLRRNGM